MRSAVVVMIVLAVTGCTTGDLGQQWTKADVGMAQWTLDELDCGRRASVPPGTYESWVGGVADLGRIVVEQRQRTGLNAECMAAAGYQRRP